MASSSDWHALLPGLELERAAPSPPRGLVVTIDQMIDRLAEAGLLDVARRSAQQDRPLTLVVNDTHRPTDTASFISAVFTLLDGDISISEKLRCRMLVASGTHADSSDERVRHESAVSGAFADRFEQIRWNNADDATEQTAIGDYRFHHWMGEGGLYVACGSTEPHYFAGVTGAHKTLTVGVMARESIEANHAHAMDPCATGLRLSGNPVHEGIVAALSALGATGAELLCLNQLVVDGVATAAWAGSPLDALEAALPTVRDVFAHRIEQAADVIVASVAAPLDRDLYQADKGIKNTEAALRDGGILLVEAACPRGVGIAHFLDLLRSAPDYDEAMRQVSERGYQLGDHKAVRLRALTDRRRVRLGVLSPNLDSSMEALLGARIFSDAAAAAAWILAAVGESRARGVWATDAGNITLEVA
jgi:nickel-dependent lactate racemase